MPVIQYPTAEFAWLRQTSRNNNAAVVPEGTVKPTSVIGLTRVESSLAVVAHLSEAIPRYWLLDNAELERFLESELTFGLAAAVEKKLLVDIAGTSGIALQPYATSTLVTLRKGLTVLEAAGYTPSAAVLHPLDWESVELAITTQQAVEHLSLPYDVTARRLFGVPIVVTVSATVGVGYVLADGAVAVDSDTNGVGVTWSENQQRR